MLYGNPQWLLLMIVSIVIGGMTQRHISNTYRKWSRVPLMSGLSGAQVARRILDMNQLGSVEVAGIDGNLTDNYDPRSKKLSLSHDVFATPSVAAAGVAAHESGHAIQDAQGYLWGRVRSALVPAVNFGSTASGVLIVLGFLIGATGLLWLGIAAYSLAVLFQVVTLPVEFDASRRALATLESSGMMSPDQLSGARQVLTAAALTYVAAALISILNLLYYVGIARRD